MASEYALDNVAQGGAYINNLICGKMVHNKVLARSTQYHLPHSTEVAGFSLVYGGDDRFYNTKVLFNLSDIRIINITNISKYNGYRPILI